MISVTFCDSVPSFKLDLSLNRSLLAVNERRGVDVSYFTFLGYTGELSLNCINISHPTVGKIKHVSILLCLMASKRYVKPINWSKLTFFGG